MAGRPNKGQGQCPFCQLIQQPEQLNIVGETDNFYAWLEYPQPRAKGHANVVPKEHTESLMELDPEQYQEALNLAREVMEKQMKALDADGVSLIVNVEEAAGQMLPHMYIQLFPRYQDRETSGTPAGAVFPQDEELAGSVEDVRQEMNQVDVEFGVEKIEPHPEGQHHKNDNSSDSETKKQKKESPNSSDEEVRVSDEGDKAGEDGFGEEVELDGQNIEWK